MHRVFPNAAPEAARIRRLRAARRAARRALRGQHARPAKPPGPRQATNRQAETSPRRSRPRASNGEDRLPDGPGHRTSHERRNREIASPRAGCPCHVAWASRPCQNNSPAVAWASCPCQKNSLISRAGCPCHRRPCRPAHSRTPGTCRARARPWPRARRDRRPAPRGDWRRRSCGRARATPASAARTAAPRETPRRPQRHQRMNTPRGNGARRRAAKPPPPRWSARARRR